MLIYLKQLNYVGGLMVSLLDSRVAVLGFDPFWSN